MRLLFLLFSFLFVSQFSVLSQQSSATWPFTNVARPNCTSMPPAVGSTCTAWPIQNGRWDVKETWYNDRIPGNMDIVCIPAGITVTVKNPTYTATTVCPVTNTAVTPQLFIFCCGTIDFDASGKLHLGCNSSIQILPGTPAGRILPANGNSDLIQIGTTVVWRDNNTTLTGPTCVCDGCPANNTGCVFSAPLPSQLISFSANQKNQYQIELSWLTLQEFNTDNFIVEKSLNGANWLQVGNLFAKGGESQKTSYNLTDSKPVNGINYYRLKKLDRDGHFEYSNIVQVNFRESALGFSVFPNPAKDKVTIYAKSGFTQGMQAQLYHKNGMLLETKYIQSANAQSMDISDLSNGLYFMRIVDAKGVTLHTQSVIKN